MGRGRAVADAGTGGPGRRGGTRETTLDRGGPTPRGIEADPAEGGRRDAGGPGPTPERAGQGGAAERGGGMARGGPTPRGIEGEAKADAGRGRRRTREAPQPPAPPRGPGGRGAGGAAKLTRGPRSGDHRSARGRRTPPTDSWGVRRPRGGQDARPIRPRMGPGRRQAPRRPHDAGRPIRDVAGTRGRRRPDRGGRP